MLLHGLPDHPRLRKNLVLRGLVKLTDGDLQLLSILRRQRLRAFIRREPLRGTWTWS